MKKFEFLFCFLLCVLPCVFSERDTSDMELEMISRSIGLTVQDVQDCLNKMDTDWDTIMELSNAVLTEKVQYTKDMVTKVGCFGACIYKKNGVLVNSKIVPEKILELTTRETQAHEPPMRLRTTLDKCSKLVSSETDDCRITLSFSRCVMQDMSRY